jgi:hypothetical protein
MHMAGYYIIKNFTKFVFKNNKALYSGGGI